MFLVRELGPGGTERQLAEMARSLDRSRFEVHVGYFRGGIRLEELRRCDITVFRLRVTSFIKPTALNGAWKLVRYLRKHRIQLLHTFDYPLNCFGVPVARLARVPVILSSQRAHRDLTPAPYLRVLRLTDRLVDGIVVNSEAIRREMIGKEHVPASLLHLCYNGIDTLRFHAQRRLRVAALENASLVIGVVCVLRPEKGLTTLIEAFKRVASADVGLRLAIVGSGPEETRLEKLANELGISGQCVFQPTVSDVAVWMKSIDIFVLPSISEALSNSLMEAMACGCACIASRTGGNPELIRDGQTGLLFESSDSEDLARKLRLLIDGVPLRSRLVQSASRLIVERFSLAASVERMQEIYTSYLETREQVKIPLCPVEEKVGL